MTRRTSDAHPTVRVRSVETSRGMRHAAICDTHPCPWSSTGHVVRAAAEEQARAHRDMHRQRAAKVSAS